MRPSASARRGRSRRARSCSGTCFKMPRKTRVCFVTGTRAEFGLMRSTLRAIEDHPKLKLQIIATGMHLDRRHGDGLCAIRDEGWKIDAEVPWKRSPRSRAESTGAAMAGIARKLD